MNKRERKLRWHILMALALTLVVFYSPFVIVNNGAFQRWFLATYKPFQPWKVEFESLRLRPWPPRIRIKRLTMIHPAGHQITFKTINIKPKIWPLLVRGKLALKQFTLDHPTITLVETPKLSKEKKGKGFKLRTLLLLQNLLLEDARIKSLTFNLPDKKTLTTELILVDLSPSLLHGTKLGLDFKKIGFQSEKKMGHIEKLSFNVETDFSQWSKKFPYLDNVDGSLKIEQTLFGGWDIKNVEAKLRLEKNQLTSKKFSIQIGEDFLLGKLNCDIIKEIFALELNTPKSIAVPEIEEATRTFNVAGDLSLDLQLKGKGFKLKTSQGTGALKVTHQFRNFEEHPAQADLNFGWEQGRLHLSQGTVSTDNTLIQASGEFRFQPPSLNLQFSSQDFPLERFFEKFEDTNLHPIHGKGKLEGTVQGLGKTIHLKIKGEATEGGYGPLLLQKALVDLDLTYQQLKLSGSIVTEEKETGKALFTIDYGPKQKDLPRPKKIFVEAGFTDHPLETLLPDYASSGLLNAQIKLAGPQKEIRGGGQVRITEGELFGIALESAELPFELTTQKLTIPKAVWIFSNNEQQEFIHPTVFQFQPGGFLLTGSPLAGLKMEIKYISQEKKWVIQKFQYRDPAEQKKFAEASGTVTPEAINLKTKGNINLKIAALLSRTLREGEGPVTFDLATSGSPSNIALQGWVRFDGNLLSLRAYPLLTEELTGTVQFKGNRIETAGLKGLWGAGSFSLAGSMTHDHWVPHSFDLTLDGTQLYFRDKKGIFRMEYDAKLTLKGTTPHTQLKGNITVLDGKYTKDFNIIEEVKTAKKPPQEILKVTENGFPINLDLTVRNLGDFTIDNNVGRIDLNSALRITGSRFAPRIEGTVQVTEGAIHYLGLDFDITHGFLEFRDPYTNPYLEIEAEQDVGDSHIIARLHGRTNNLLIDLEGNSATLGPLDKKDVISLILFGMTTSERIAAGNQQYELGPTLAAQQITQALQRPVSKLTKLDILRLEATPTESGRTRRLYIGKKLSDRISVEFASEMGEQEISQTFGLEYWITDFFILKGERARRESYQLNAGFRIQSR